MKGKGWEGERLGRGKVGKGKGWKGEKVGKGKWSGRGNSFGKETSRCCESVLKHDTVDFTNTTHLSQTAFSTVIVYYIFNKHIVEKDPRDKA